MTEWIWQHIIGPTINNTFAFIPAWVWIIVAGLLIGWAWKTFGWQGVLGAALAVLTIGAYRQGWKSRDSLETENVDGPDADPSPAKPKRPKRPVKPPEDTWFDRVKRGE